MARKVPGLAPGQIVEFVPTLDGNDADPSPVKVFIRAPTQGEKRQYLAETIKTVRFGTGAGGEVALDFADVLERKRLAIVRFVEKVDGYEDAAGAPIVDAAGLWERGELELCSEVADKIDALLSITEQHRKNSEGSSGSLPAATPGSSGTAASASSEDFTATATVTAPQIQSSSITYSAS